MSCREGSDGEGEAGHEAEEEEDDESGCMTNRSVPPSLLSQYTGSRGRWRGGGAPKHQQGLLITMQPEPAAGYVAKFRKNCPIQGFVFGAMLCKVCCRISTSQVTA